jgi:hypothetical protein
MLRCAMYCASAFRYSTLSRSTGPLVEVIVVPDLAQRAEIKTHRPFFIPAVPWA